MDLICINMSFLICVSIFLLKKKINDEIYIKILKQMVLSHIKFWILVNFITKGVLKFVSRIWKPIYRQWSVGFENAHLKSHFGWYKSSKTLHW